jgi:hypothetical protein
MNDYNTFIIIQQEDPEVVHHSVGEVTFWEVGADVAQGADVAEGEDEDEDNVGGVAVDQLYQLHQDPVPQQNHGRQWMTWNVTLHHHQDNSMNSQDPEHHYHQLPHHWRSFLFSSMTQSYRRWLKEQIVMQGTLLLRRREQDF